MREKAADYYCNTTKPLCQTVRVPKNAENGEKSDENVEKSTFPRVYAGKPYFRPTNNHNNTLEQTRRMWYPHNRET
jgi:hypothetical protein